ncbi:MAG: alanine racemase, partial [Nitrospiraceae bacterium]
QELAETVASPALLRGTLRLEGIMSHLADADNQDPTYTQSQIHEFDEAIRLLTREGRLPELVHLANSAGILLHPSSHHRLVRPGIMLYGYHTLPALPSGVTLRPVLSWQTTVAHLRTVEAGASVSYNRTFVATRRSRIAVLPVGYADGYNRLLSNRGRVLVRGRRASVVGRVCMDMTMIDVTDCPGAAIGDPVVLIGRQEQEGISAEEMAGWLQTIPYEVLCAIGTRVPRIYQPADPASAQ